MYKHLLIATDGSELARTAVQQGLGLARSVGARVTIATVTEPWTAVVSGELGVAFPVEEYDKGCAASAAQILDSATRMAREAGVACETVHVPNQFPAEGIIETAKSLGCDLIVMASHGRRGLTRLLLGSQAAKVVTMSTTPVLICR